MNARAILDVFFAFAIILVLWAWAYPDQFGRVVMYVLFW